MSRTAPLIGLTLVAVALVGLYTLRGDAPPPTPEHDGPAAATPEASGPRDMLVIAYQADIGNLNAVVYETANDGSILGNLHMNTLYSAFDCSIEYKPGLAKSFSWNDAGDVLAMELRDDITFADGEPVTARDIALSYELAGDPAVASPRISYLEHMKPGHSPKVIDDTHLEFHFNGVYDRTTLTAESTTLLASERKIWAEADRAGLRSHPRSLDPIPSGPYKLAKHVPNDRFVLEPNENFTGPEEMRSRLKRIVFRVLPEYTTRLLSLQNGEVDMMDSIEIADADQLRKSNPEIRIVRRGWRTMDYIAWNTQNPLFSDKNVRRALTHAVDLDEMIKKLLTSESGEVYARKATGTITPELCDAYNADITPLTFDPDKAKKMLAEAGWADTDNDGWLDKGGKKFSFTLSTNTGNKRRADVQIFVQDYLKKVGIEVRLEKIEANTCFGSLREKNFEAAVAGWEAALFVDPSNMWRSETEDKKYPFNFTSYGNPEVDALIDQGLSQPDPKKAAPYWKELQLKVYEDQPYMFLWWRDELVGIHERFENTDINVLSRLNHLWEWEVPPDKVKYKL